MIFQAVRKRSKLFAALAFTTCLIFTVGAFFYKDDLFLNGKSWLSVQDIEVKSRFQKVLLPAGFVFPEKDLRDYLKGTSAETWQTLQLTDFETMETPPLDPGMFKTTESTLFGLSKGEQCNIKNEMKLGTDASHNLSLDLAKIFKIFREEAASYGDTYNQHIGPIFEDFMEGEKLEKYWFRFAGSSVWLKDFNVHFVVSRLTFSKTPIENFPRVSLLLAQVFDEKWEEIEDVRLIFPTNEVGDSPSFQIDGQHFMSERFPRIIPVPFYVTKDGVLQGAEDPRIMLVKNENGHEEPIVVFNAAHEGNMPEEDESKAPLEKPRSMFITFPFQRQRGKRIMNLDDDSTKNNLFLRTNHLEYTEKSGSLIEKNWTPFVSSSAGNYDKHVYFATQLEPLKVIACELWENDKICVVQNEIINEGAVGALRGGTPLYSLKRIESEDKEYFFGIARAHLTNCGCGTHFYRPNLVVVERNGKKWTLSHVSSSIDLGMEVLPWNQGPKLCDFLNAMIPNGIEFFDSERDLLSVFVSVSDVTVERVTVHGILRELQKAEFWKDEKPDFTKSPVTCAMNTSADFCKAYGDLHQSQRRFARDFGTFMAR